MGLTATTSSPTGFWWHFQLSSQDARRPIGPAAWVFRLDGELVQLNATASGISVGWRDGEKLEAVLAAAAPLVLGLAAGVLSLDDVRALIDQW